MVFYPGCCIRIIQVRSWSIDMLHISSGQCFWSSWGHYYLPILLLFCSHTHLGILKFLQGSKDPGHGTIFATHPSHVHYSRLTPKLKFLYQEQATQEQTMNTPRQFGKLYWYSVTVSVQPQLSLNLCFQYIL